MLHWNFIQKTHVNTNCCIKNWYKSTSPQFLAMLWHVVYCYWTDAWVLILPASIMDSFTWVRGWHNDITLKSLTHCQVSEFYEVVYMVDNHDNHHIVMLFLLAIYRQHLAWDVQCKVHTKSLVYLATVSITYTLWQCS